jgi:hypothetical protein
MLDYWLEFGVITGWEYEPESMIFETVGRKNKRRDIEYIPDFRVDGLDGDETWWFECKGHMQNYDLQKWKAFKDVRTEPLCIVFAGKCSAAVNKVGRMKRLVDRVWEHVNKEFKKSQYRNMP